jgi:hypothetical protein
MRRKASAGQRVNAVDAHRLREDRPAGPVCVGVDVGKHPLFAVCRWAHWDGARNGRQDRRRNQGDHPMHSLQPSEGSGPLHSHGPAVGGKSGVCQGVVRSPYRHFIP